MLSAREIVPLTLATALLVAVGVMALDVRASKRERATAPEPAVALQSGVPTTDASPPRAREGSAAAARVNPSDLGALPLRDAALPAPTRDLAAIRRELARRAGTTYIEDMLATDDSTLVRWPDRTVAALKVWVQPRSDVPHWDDRYPRLVRDVFTEWSAAGFPLRFLHVVDSAGADLHVRFTTALPGRQIGLTNRIRDRHGWIVGAEVTVATQDERGEPFPPSLVAGIARHEVGHALGLGHTVDQTALMYPESRTTIIGPMDRATLHLLYTLPPGSVR
jgi:hypothetical protein